MKRIALIFIVCIFSLSLFGCELLSELFDDKSLNHTEQTGVVKQIYVFGDSLSDNGNFFYIVRKLLLDFNVHLQYPPADEGGQKFTDGNLVVEYLAENYNITIIPAWEILGPVLTGSFNTLNLVETEHKGMISNLAQPYEKSISLTQSQETTIRNFIDQLQVKKVSKGNNYAFVNTTIGRYDGAINEFFNFFNLGQQVVLHGNSPPSDIDSDTTLHLIIIGGNDIMNIASSSETLAKQKEHITNMAVEYVKQISNLSNLGSKKILAFTAPLIGDIPQFVNSQIKNQANELSNLLEQELQKKINADFSTNSVRYVSFIQIFNEIKTNWSPTRQTQACVDDIANGYFDFSHFILNEGELAVKYKNGCDDSMLTNGQFLFFDNFHGTDRAYQDAVVYFINEVEKFMGR